jgi:hypothetical protein
MRAFSSSRDPEKRSSSHHCEQIRRLISAGSEAGSLQVLSAADPRLRGPKSRLCRPKCFGEQVLYRILLRRCCERYNWRRDHSRIVSTRTVRRRKPMACNDPECSDDAAISEAIGRIAYEALHLREDMAALKALGQVRDRVNCPLMLVAMPL